MKIKVYDEKILAIMSITQCARFAHFLLVDARAALQPTKKNPLANWRIKSSSLVIGHHGLVKGYERTQADYNNHS